MAFGKICRRHLSEPNLPFFSRDVINSGVEDEEGIVKLSKDGGSLQLNSCVEKGLSDHLVNSATRKMKVLRLQQCNSNVFRLNTTSEDKIHGELGEQVGSEVVIDDWIADIPQEKSLKFKINHSRKSRKRHKYTIQGPDISSVVENKHLTHGNTSKSRVSHGTSTRKNKRPKKSDLKNNRTAQRKESKDTKVDNKTELVGYTSSTLSDFVKPIQDEIKSFLLAHVFECDRKPYVSRSCHPNMLELEHPEIFAKLKKRLQFPDVTIDNLTGYLCKQFPEHLVSTKDIVGCVQRLEDVTDYVIECFLSSEVHVHVIPCHSQQLSIS